MNLGPHVKPVGFRNSVLWPAHRVDVGAVLVVLVEAEQEEDIGVDQRDGDYADDAGYGRMLHLENGPSPLVAEDRQESIKRQQYLC